MRTIAIINQKGGCGKTTTAINLAATLARQGKRTLLVDMDPQSHCAAGLGIPEGRIEMDIGDAMLAVGQRPIDPPRLLWRAVRNLDLAPSRMRLAGLEASRGGLAELQDKDKRLSAVLQGFRTQYDIACIDCPPSIGLLTYNALAAADMVLIPVETSFFSLKGATRQVNTVKTIARRLGRPLPVWLLATIHDESSAVAIDLLDELHRQFSTRVIPTVIRRDVKLREAASFGQTVVDYAPGSAGAEDYARLGAWVADHLQADTLGALGEVDTAHVPDTLPSEIAPPTGETAIPEPVGAAGDAPTERAGENEVKPISRAEDVARRAQEFLRRVALGRSTSPSSPAASAPMTDASAPATTQTYGLSPDVADLPAGPVFPPSNPLRLFDSARAKPASISPSAQRLLGVRETNQGLLFVQPLTCGERVAVAGEFNGWSGESDVFRRNAELGVHELCLRLPPGKHLYRLVVDGQWSADPHNDACEPNPFGETNSIALVGSRAGIVMAAAAV